LLNISAAARAQDQTAPGEAFAPPGQSIPCRNGTGTTLMP
jgi:hypothetical protein